MTGEKAETLKTEILKSMNCEYQTYRDGRLQDCGMPATHRGVKPPKRCYCKDHNEQVSKRGGLKTEEVGGQKSEVGQSGN